MELRDIKEIVSGISLVGGILILPMVFANPTYLLISVFLMFLGFILMGWSVE